MTAKVKAKTKTVVEAKSRSKPIVKDKTRAAENVRVVNKISPPHANGEERKTKGMRIPQYAYMKAPGIAHDFQVGDTVEVYCDHEKNKERVRGWIRGVVVQVDNKMVAVQFRSNVFLTDGWMVPDRILWYPLNSEHIRPVAKKSGKREKLIPDY
jgi:transposase